MRDKISSILEGIKKFKCRKVLKKILERSELISTSSNSFIDSSLLFELQKEKHYEKVHLDMPPFREILYDFYLKKVEFKNHGKRFIIEPRYAVHSERYYIAKEVK